MLGIHLPLWWLSSPVDQGGSNTHWVRFSAYPPCSAASPESERLFSFSFYHSNWNSASLHKGCHASFLKFYVNACQAPHFEMSSKRFKMANLVLLFCFWADPLCSSQLWRLPQAQIVSCSGVDYSCAVVLELEAEFWLTSTKLGKEVLVARNSGRFVRPSIPSRV